MGSPYFAAVVVVVAAVVVSAVVAVGCWCSGGSRVSTAVVVVDNVQAGTGSGILEIRDPSLLFVDFDVLRPFGTFREFHQKVPWRLCCNG